MTKNHRTKSKRATPRIRRRSKPGEVPGRIAINPKGGAPLIHTIRYSASKLEEAHESNVESLSLPTDPSMVTWINVTGLGNERLFDVLQRKFSLHGLALEDVVNSHQRAKVEEYDDHVFIVARMVSQNESLEFEQLSIFFGKNFVLTLQEKAGDCLEPVRYRLRQAHGRIREARTDYLVYSILDAVVDSYFPITDAVGERLELLDESISNGVTQDVMRELHVLRGELMQLRRTVRPFRDALVHLLHDPHSVFSDQTEYYLRDCYDHSIQLMDLLDTYREMCSDLRDYYMSAMNTRMNEVMKVLTIIATVFIPLSFVAGVYGMNFNTNLPGNMPELDWPYGYVWSLGLMTLIASGLVGFIWKKGWLSDEFSK